MSARSTGALAGSVSRTTIRRPPLRSTCTTSTTKSVCVQKAPTYACTKTVDGVVEPATCGGACTKSETQTVPPYESLHLAAAARRPTNGMAVSVRERTATSRLHDGRPADLYPGYVETGQKCLNPDRAVDR